MCIVGVQPLTYKASKRMGSIRPAKIVGATPQYLYYASEEINTIFLTPTNRLPLSNIRQQVNSV